MNFEAIQFFINSGIFENIEEPEVAERVMFAFVQVLDADSVFAVQRMIKDLQQSIAYEERVRSEDMFRVIGMFNAAIRPMQWWLERQQEEATA